MPDNQTGTPVLTGDNIAEAQKTTHKIDDADAYIEDADKKDSGGDSDQSGQKSDGIIGEV